MFNGIRNIWLKLGLVCLAVLVAIAHGSAAFAQGFPTIHHYLAHFLGSAGFLGFAGATLSATNPTLLDFEKRMDPDGQVATVVEMLKQTNEVLEDMTFIEGNLLTGNRTTVRTGLPVPTWRKLYGGVQPGKSTTAQVTDNCGMLEAYAEVDKALADLNGNTQAFRLSEDSAYIEGMNIEFARCLFYGNEGTQPEAFTGFAPRFNAIAGAQNGLNVLSGGGSGNVNTSVWLIVWSPLTCFGIIPKGSVAGLNIEDKGQVTIENVDGNGGRMEAYRTHYRWDLGLCVRDWRYVVRIANIDVTTLTKNAGSGADLIDLMAQAIELLPSQSLGRAVFYCNRTVKSFLRRQIANKIAAGQLTMDQIAGKHVLSFDGIPVRRCDALISTEATIS
jgi:hypothetical protein